MGSGTLKVIVALMGPLEHRAYARRVPTGGRRHRLPQVGAVPRVRALAPSGDKRMGRAEVPAELPGSRQCDCSSNPWRLDIAEEGTAPRRGALTLMHDGERADLS